MTMWPHFCSESLGCGQGFTHYLTDVPQNDLKSLAPDLANGEFPRSPRETLAGYVVAARTLDKCRAELADTIGDYHFDCPLDNFFLNFSGISAEEFKTFVATGADDDAVGKWIADKGEPR